MISKELKDTGGDANEIMLMANLLQDEVNSLALTPTPENIEVVLGRVSCLQDRLNNVKRAAESLMTKPTVDTPQSTTTGVSG